MRQILSLRAMSIAAAIVVAGVLLWYFYLGHAGDNGGYETKPVDRGTIERVVSASGPVNAVVTVQVGSQVSGQIAVLDVDYNDRVKKGQRLALIDPQTFQSKVTQAEGDLAGARTQKALAQANLTRANAQLVKERRVLGRLETLSAKGFASTEALDTQKAVIASAEADVSVAKAQVQNAQAVIDAKAAALAQAKIDLSHTVITSPIDGIVIARSIDLGQTVAASLQAPTLFQIAQDLSQVQIEAQVDESDIGNVAEGQNVTFSVGSYAQREFHGTVSQVRVGGVNLQNVVTYSVIVSAPNADLKLLPGMTASVKILTGRRDNALRLPNEALRFRPPSSLQGASSTPSRAQGGAGRREEMIKELTAALQLTEAQQQALAAALPQRSGGGGGQWRRDGGGGNGSSGGSDNADPSGGGGGAQGGAGGVGEGGGQRGGGRGFERMIEAALGTTLSPEQRKKFEEWRASRANLKRTQVWVMRSGTPTNVSVTLGISDDRFSEIAGGEVKEGDQVVTRYTEPGA